MKRLLLLLVILPICVWGQVAKYNRTYDFNGQSEWACSLLFLQDSSVLTSGFWNNTNGEGIMLLNWDHNGNVIDDKHFSRQHKNYTWMGPGSLMLIDSNYYVAGCVQWQNVIDPSIGYSYPFLAKYNLSRDTVWVKHFVDTTKNYYMPAYHVTKDKCILIIGSVIYRNNPGISDYCVIKVDTQGHVLWEREYGDISNNEDGCSVSEFTDSSLLITGQKQYGVSSMGYLTKPWLIKTDKNGYNIQWQKEYTSPSMSYGGVIAKNATGSGFIISGIADTIIQANNFATPNYIGKIDTNGNVLWRSYFNDFFDIEIWDFEVLPNGKIIVCGVKYDSTYHSNGLPFGFMSLLDSNGNKLWERTYVTDSTWVNYLTCVHAAPDGGFVACGSANGITGVQNDWVVKTDSNGCELINCTLGIGVLNNNDINTLTIFPNPAKDLLHINNIAVGTQYRITDYLFRTVQNGVFTQEQNTIQIQSLPAGVYLLQLTNLEGQREVVRVVKE